MIDVVFLLIIFFLVSSHLAKQEAQMDIDLPNAESGLESEPSTNPRIVINVTQSGQLLISGRRVSEEQIENRLAEYITNNGANIEVRIRSDRQIPLFKYDLSCWHAPKWGFGMCHSLSIPRTKDNGK